MPPEDKLAELGLELPAPVKLPPTHCPFRGLLRLHSRYGPHARSTAQGGLCHGASTGSVTRPRRPSANSSIDNSLGGTLFHR